MLANKSFQTLHIIGWLQIHQPIRDHAGKSLLTNIDIDMDLS